MYIILSSTYNLFIDINDFSLLSSSVNPSPVCSILLDERCALPHNDLILTYDIDIIYINYKIMY